MFVLSDLWAQGSDLLSHGVAKITAKSERQQPKVGNGVVVRVDKDAVYIITAAYVVEVLMFIGFPRMLSPWTVSTGILSGMNGLTLAFQVLVEEGHSGGPLLLNGQVVGVAGQTRERLGYAVPASIVSVALGGWRIEARPSEGMVPLEKVGPDGASMVLIKSGKYPTKTVGVYMAGRVEEIPGTERSLYLSDDFSIESTLVTTARFLQFVEATGWVGSMGWNESVATRKPDDPIVDVAWHDADVFCKWARKRLLTEHEWEKAAHDARGRILNGQVHEWAASTYKELRLSPDEPEDKTPKVIRGALEALGVKTVEGGADCQVRMYANPDEGFPDRGFRCVEDNSKER